MEEFVDPDRLLGITFAFALPLSLYRFLGACLSHYGTMPCLCHRPMLGFLVR